MEENNSIARKEIELRSLLEITQAINNNLSEESLYKIYHFTLLANLNIKKLCLYVLDDAWECKVNFGTSADFYGISLPENYKNLKSNQKVNDCEAQFCEFSDVIPVSHKDRLLAVLLAVGSEMEDTGVDLTFLQAITNIIIVAIENKKLARKQLEQEAYRKEMEIAKQVQNYLFPKYLPKEANLQLEASYIPHNKVGGDYYDYITVDASRFILCIADVSGKGVPAALLMSNFQASLRTLVRKSDNLTEIVSELNYQINLSGNAENFITFFIALYDAKTKKLSFVNCGHNPPLLLEREKETLLEAGTTILGMFQPLPFIKEGEVTDLENFLLFCYTDGLTETFDSNDEEFGQDRLFDIVRETKDSSPV
ncbi:MAG: SpoIIE family protein phosphatase, partial [Cyclobacteriaceae bacterium]